MIGIPCYGSQVFCEFTQSLLKLVQLFNDNNIEHEVVFLGSESLISRARNSLTAKFYSESKFSHLLFLDADLIFNPESIIKMLGEDKELIGCPYPKKKYNWNKVFDNSLDPSKAEQELFLYTDVYYNLLKKGKMVGTVLETKDIPTGCMLIRRSVITALMLARPNRKYQNNIAGMEEDGMNNYFYDLFGTGVIDGVYLSEDYYFCHLVRELGINCYLESGYTFGHIGKEIFYGNLYAQIQKYGFNDKTNLDKIAIKKQTIK